MNERIDCRILIECWKEMKMNTEMNKKEKYYKKNDIRVKNWKD